MGEQGGARLSAQLWVGGRFSQLSSDVSRVLLSVADDAGNHAFLTFKNISAQPRLKMF